LKDEIEKRKSIKRIRVKYSIKIKLNQMIKNEIEK
jgi:hypothetical protein